MGCGGGTTTKTDKPQWFDPLGPASIDPKTGKQTFTTTGGVPLREQIFDYLGPLTDKLQNNAGNIAAGYQSAASDPGYLAAAENARKTISGDYLSGSPQFDAAMNAARTRTMADASDADARIQQQYGRAGMGWSTANQQARQASRAATAARAGETEAAARGQNYQLERERQTQGADMLAKAQGIPLEYLSKTNEAYTQPLSQIAQLVQGLSGQGQLATPNSMTMKQPGALDYLSTGITSATGLGSLLGKGGLGVLGAATT